MLLIVILSLLVFVFCDCEVPLMLSVANAPTCNILISVPTAQNDLTPGVQSIEHYIADTSVRLSFTVQNRVYAGTLSLELHSEAVCPTDGYLHIIMEPGTVQNDCIVVHVGSTLSNPAMVLVVACSVTGLASAGLTVLGEILAQKKKSTVVIDPTENLQYPNYSVPLSVDWPRESTVRDTAETQLSTEILTFREVIEIGTLQLCPLTRSALPPIASEHLPPSSWKRTNDAPASCWATLHFTKPISYDDLS